MTEETKSSSSAAAAPAAAASDGSSSSSSLLSKKAISPLIAGLSGGTVSTVLLLPLDNIKVRLQVNEGYSSSSSTKQQPQQRLGAIRMFKGVIQHEGISGLYQGITPAVIGSAVSWGGFFYVYETMKRQLKQYKQQQAQQQQQPVQSVNDITLSSMENFQMATLSGVVLVFGTNPVWLIKLRMQLQMKKTTELMSQNGTKIVQYNGFVDALRKIVRDEGFFALYKGTGPALLLTSHGGVQFVVYEFLRKHFHYTRAQQQEQTSSSSSSTTSTTTVIKKFEDSLGYLTIGAISKMVASTVTYPFQVVKSRMQQPSNSIELTSSGDVRVVQRDYKGLLATVHKIWKQEGISGFFKGAIPNAVRVAPSAAVTFLVYETVMDFLK